MDNWSAETFASSLDDTPAAQPVSDLSEEALLASDLAYHQKKASGELQRERERIALELDVAALRRRGFL